MSKTPSICPTCGTPLERPGDQHLLQERILRYLAIAGRPVTWEDFRNRFRADRAFLESTVASLCGEDPPRLYTWRQRKETGARRGRPRTFIWDHPREEIPAKPAENAEAKQERQYERIAIIEAAILELLKTKGPQTHSEILRYTGTRSEELFIAINNLTDYPYRVRLDHHSNPRGMPTLKYVLNNTVEPDRIKPEIEKPTPKPSREKPKLNPFDSAWNS